jgi:pimeloyl-ACP methyl ester carboxylesterase
MVGPILLPHLNRISPLQATSRVLTNVPVLILVGNTDRSARPEEAQALHQKMKTHSNLLSFPGAGHGDLFGCDPKLYLEAVVKFCRQAWGGAQLNPLSLAPSQLAGR